MKIKKVFFTSKDFVNGFTFDDYKIEKFNIFEKFNFPSAQAAMTASFMRESPIDYHLIVYINENGKKIYLKDHVGAERLEKRLKNYIK